MKKILFLLLIILTMTGCGFGTQTNVLNRTKIIVGIDDSFAPMGFRDENGDIVGFDVDLAKEAARRLGVAIEFKSINWDNKEEEITSGNIDMIWNGCDIINEYKEYMIFSKPYMDNRQILMVKWGNVKGILSEYDLKDKVVATQAGSNSEDYINSNKSLKNSFAEFRTYRDIQKGFMALDKEECDVLIIDEIAARYEMNIHPDKFEIVEVTIGPVTEFGIGFRKDNTELRDKVQVVFDDMIKDGTAKEISEQWFQADLIKLKKRY